MAFPFGLSKWFGGENKAPSNYVKSGNTVRSIDAGGGGRRWRDAPMLADAAGPMRAAAGLIASRAQALALNNPTLARISDALPAHLVGTGITPRPMHPVEDTRALLAASFLTWTDRAETGCRTDFYGLQAALVRDMVVMGEALAVFEVDPVDGAPQLRRLHPDQLDRSVTRQTAGGGHIIAGVEFNARGVIVAYHIRPGAPGETLAGLPLTPECWPASDVIHMFRPLVPGQVRGLSWFAPSLLSARELDQFLDAVLVRAKVAALHAGFVVEPNGAPIYDGEQTGGSLNVSMEPGAMVVLPPGKSVEFPSLPEQGNATAIAHDFERRIATGIGATYEMATGDHSQANYSSSRSALLEFRRFAEGVQHHVVVHQLCRPVWRRFVTWCVLSGRIGATAFQANRDAFLAAKWLPPAWPWVDPVKDARAAILEMDANLRSRAEVVAERGYDIETLDREIAADRARAQRLGLSPSQTSETTNG